jgi:hypothetical protein
MLEGKYSRIVVFLIYFTVFVNSITLFTSPFEFYAGYFIYLLLLPGLLMRHGLKNISMVLLFFLFLFLNGLLHLFLGNNTSDYFFKIFFGTFFSYIFYYEVIVESGYDIEKLFQYYLKGVYIVCVIGYIQFIGFQLHIESMYDYHWILNKWSVCGGGNFGIRINSVFSEPSFFSITISSAVFVAVCNIITKQSYYYTKLESLLIIIIYFLSFSGVGYLGVFIIIMLLFVNYGFLRYFIVFVPIAIGIFSVVYQNVPEFRDRYDSTIDIFSTGKFKIGNTHGSSLILYNNYYVAVRNFKDYYLGTGLGSHPIAFAKYSLTHGTKVAGIDQNNLDANSMFNRLLSETGVVGVGLFILLIFKSFVRKNSLIPGNDSHWIISNALLLLILLNLLRQGHYFLNGFPLFMWLYYYNKSVYLKKVAAYEMAELPAEPLIAENA